MTSTHRSASHAAPSTDPRPTDWPAVRRTAAGAIDMDFYRKRALAERRAAQHALLQSIAAGARRALDNVTMILNQPMMGGR